MAGLEDSEKRDAEHYAKYNDKQRPESLTTDQEDHFDSGKPLPKEYPASIYEHTQERWFFVLMIGLAACVSTVSVPIYFPTLDLLAHSFHVSVSKINVTATVYSIFQGVSPLLWAALSDSWGRRPVYFCCFFIYLGANIGLALSKSYGTLLGLRILQAFGAASTVSLIGGSVGDFSSRKTRGSLVGIAMGISQLGNCFGPLIGGGIEYQFNTWRSIFWALAIFAGLMIVLVFFLLPETNRHVVGNGSRYPPLNLWHLPSWSPYIMIRRHVTHLPLKQSDSGYNDEWILPPKKIRWMRWAELFFQPRVMLLLLPTALHYTTWYMVLTAQSTLLAQNYGMTTHQIGFTYLSSGVGTFGSSVISGKLMQYAYKRQARFVPINIYRARIGYSFYSTTLVVATTLVFGWTLHFNVSFYVPVVMTCFISAGATFFLSTTSALLVDLFPGDSAASQSCNNLARCCMCAGGLAAVQSMMENMTIGGTFTFLAGLCALSSGCFSYLLSRYGPKRSDQRPANFESPSSEGKPSDR